MITLRGLVAVITVLSVASNSLAAFRLGDSWGTPHQASIWLRLPVAAACLAFENEGDASLRKHASHALFYTLHALDDAIAFGRTHESHPVLSDACWFLYDVAYAAVHAKKAWVAQVEGDQPGSVDIKKTPEPSGVTKRALCFLPILIGAFLRSGSASMKSDDAWAKKLADAIRDREGVETEGLCDYLESPSVKLRVEQHINNFWRVLEEACLAPSDDRRCDLAFLVALCLSIIPEDATEKPEHRAYWKQKVAVYWPQDADNVD